MNEVKQERRAVIFTNTSKEDFHHTWDSVTYKFKAGKSQYLEFPLAYHFAKHLAWRELGQEKFPEKSPTFQDFIKSCISDEDDTEAQDETQLKQEIINKQKELEATSKGVEEKVIKTKEEEHFEGLDKPEVKKEKNETSKSKTSK